MALYRNVSISFWTDSKVDDDFTPEDKYFYLYLLTNPHTNLSGCYEISMKQMECETGYNCDTVKRLLNRMEEIHNVIRYNVESKEVLVLNWWKYNWTASQKVGNAVVSLCGKIKCDVFKKYTMDRVSILYPTVSVSVSASASVSGAGESAESAEQISAPAPAKKKLAMHKHGEYGHVRLTDEQHKKLIDEYGQQTVDTYIRKIDEYCQLKGKSYKDYNLAIRNWISRDNQEKPSGDVSSGKERVKMQAYLSTVNRFKGGDSS